MSDAGQKKNEAMVQPLCFVLMPFGRKADPTGGPDIDFDRIYHHAIKPGIEDAGLQPIRADEESSLGIIHKSMFERLLLADFAIADLTTGNANVFYELGVRHTARPATTLTLYASHQPIPFDVNFLRSVAYDIGPRNAFGDEQAAALRRDVTKWMKTLRQSAQHSSPIDSPVFELLKDWRPGDIARLKTDSFRERVEINQALKFEIEAARAMDSTDGCAQLNEIQSKIEFDGVEVGVLIDLFLSRRALSDWDGMIDLYGKFPDVLQRQILSREQYAFALNRRAGRDNNEQDRVKAVQILESILEDQGPSSETCGLLGRIYKDRWVQSKDNDPIAARGHLKRAIETYIMGFQSDWRDAYPGINSVTLLDIEGSEKSLLTKEEILPVVRYAVAQRIVNATPDYWDHATLLELEILDQNQQMAFDHLSDALIAVRETWEPATTVNNLSLIKEARESRGEQIDWLDQIICALEKKAKG